MRLRGNSREQRRRVVLAAAVAATASGLPSTIYALATGRDPLEATKAAGTILLADETRPARLIGAAVPAHLALSLLWTTALDVSLPRRGRAVWGALGGAAIAAIDLSLARRFWPRIAALPQAPQVADHVAFGALAGYVLQRLSRARSD